VLRAASCSHTSISFKDALPDFARRKAYFYVSFFDTNVVAEVGVEPTRRVNFARF
jgi:hypothetical protein